MTTCKHCGSTEVQRVRNVAANGASQVFDQCQYCGRNAHGGGKYLSCHETGPAEQFPIVTDYRKQAAPCAVMNCGKGETEYHHFAPRHIFNDAEQWPGAYLCVPHHLEWHNRLAAHMCDCDICRRLYHA